VSAASFPKPMRTNTPRQKLYHNHCSWLLQSFPKWMRWRTYERKYGRWERAVERANEEFTVRAARLLRWI
jgi:hypothetical protein